MRQPRCAQLLPVLGAARRSRCPGTGYFSISTTYRRITLAAFSRWVARSAQAFDL